MRDIGTTEKRGGIVVGDATANPTANERRFDEEKTNETEGTLSGAKAKDGRKETNGTKEMSTNANLTLCLPVAAQTMETNAEEDLANLFAPMAPSKKTKARKKLASNGNKVSLAVKEAMKEAKRGVTASSSSSKKPSSSSHAQSQPKKSGTSVRGLLLHGVSRVRTDAR